MSKNYNAYKHLNKSELIAIIECLNKQLEDGVDDKVQQEEPTNVWDRTPYVEKKSFFRKSIDWVKGY